MFQPNLPKLLNYFCSLNADKCALQHVGGLEDIDVGDYVYNLWGKKRELYRARVVALLESVSLYRVRYLDHDDDWIQWILGDRIIKVVE